jgi:transcriptional regulator with XRE-family HTH domain
MAGIGLAIREARKQRKLTRQQVAALPGMRRATISGIETGRIAEVGMRKMAALCSVLELEITAGKRRPYPA